MPATNSSPGTPPSGSSPAPRYTVLVKRSALRALDALPAAVRAELVRAIDALAENPRPVGTKKPARHELYRLRDGEAAAVLEHLASSFPADSALEELISVVYRDGLNRPDEAARHLARARELGPR